MLKKKDGFVTIEFILVSIFLIPLIVSAVGMYIYLYPTFTIQREVDVLTRQVQKHGGVRYEDMKDFEERLQGMPFIQESTREIEVHAETSPSNYNALNVTDTNYISKADDEVINLTIKVPSNMVLIKKFTKNFNDFYEFKSSVVSEKY